MAQLSYKIDIEYVWLREQTQCQKCHVCEETIFSDAYRLHVMPSTNNGKLRLKFKNIDVCICASCNSLVNAKT